MRKSIAWVLLLGLVVTLAIVTGVQAQATKDAKTGEDRIDGTVTDVNTEKSEITVKQSKTTNMVWTIVYGPETKFSVRAKASTIDKLKKGDKVICLGSFGSDKARMTATRVDVRD